MLQSEVLFAHTRKRRRNALIILLVFQILMVILFALFSESAEAHEPTFYPTLQDVTMALMVALGFMLTFLKKYCLTGISFNCLIICVGIQCGLLCDKFPYESDNAIVVVSISALIRACLASLTAVISMGAVLGWISSAQLVLMCILEIPMVYINRYICQDIIFGTDEGGSMFLHAFGAYFGLAVSYSLAKLQKRNIEELSVLDVSSYTSDMYTMFGTMILWVCFPSINSHELFGDEDYRAIANTILAMVSSCVMCFVTSGFLNVAHKFNVRHIQNATIAGGVGIAAASNMVIPPFGSLLVGMASGTLAVIGYKFVTPFMRKKMKVYDVQGVHNVHGLPGIMGGIVAAILSIFATKEEYGASFYRIFPASVPSDENKIDGPFDPGLDRTPIVQFVFQIVTLFVTLAIAIIWGLLVGAILHIPCLDRIAYEDAFTDVYYFGIPVELEDLKRMSHESSGGRESRSRSRLLKSAPKRRRFFNFL